MADINVSTPIKDALQENEKILWVGKPASFALIDSAMKSSLMLRWVISAVVGIGLLAAYIAAYAETEVFQPLIIVVIVAAFGFLMARPAMDRSALIKKTVYCITDKRVLANVGNDVHELARTGLKVSFAEGEGGNVHAGLGSCCDIAAGKLRAKALAPKRGQGDGVTGFVLYNVESAVRDFFVS